MPTFHRRDRLREISNLPRVTQHVNGEVKMPDFRDHGFHKHLTVLTCLITSHASSLGVNQSPGCDFGYLPKTPFLCLLAVLLKLLQKRSPRVWLGQATGLGTGRQCRMQDGGAGTKTSGHLSSTEPQRPQDRPPGVLNPPQASQSRPGAPARWRCCALLPQMGGRGGHQVSQRDHGSTFGACTLP